MQRLGVLASTPALAAARPPGEPMYGRGHTYTKATLSRRPYTQQDTPPFHHSTNPTFQ